MLMLHLHYFTIVSLEHNTGDFRKATLIWTLHQLLRYAGFVLPKGYPNTVTPDYLPFQLWAVPAHITGWVGTSLATSSLLKAVGVANSAAGTAAATAAIKWITKDGIGAAGRSLVSSPGHYKEMMLNVCSWILEP